MPRDQWQPRRFAATDPGVPGAGAGARRLRCGRPAARAGPPGEPWTARSA